MTVGDADGSIEISATMTEMGVLKVVSATVEAEANDVSIGVLNGVAITGADTNVVAL